MSAKSIANQLMPKPKRRKSAIDWNTVRDIGLALPGTEESTSYGTPALKVKGKLFVRLREEGDVIVILIDPKDRPARVASDGESFFVTEHYVAYPYMLVRLPMVGLDDLTELIRDAWRMVAPGISPAASRGQRKNRR